MNSDFHLVDEDNLSVAWGKAFLHVMARGASEIAPLVVTIRIDSSSIPVEDKCIRRALDLELVAHGEDDCQAVANTIFPVNLWNPSLPAHHLYDRYHKLLPRLLKYKENRNGIYFQRMIAYGETNPVNQLEHVITTYKRNNHRRTALQLAIFDPHEDHTNQRRRGFPCLQNVSFAPFGNDEMAITGFYTLQYLFTKAYGNYLGLSRLGNFVAKELGLRLTRMTCIAAVAKRGDTPIRHLEPLKEKVAAAISSRSSTRV